MPLFQLLDDNRSSLMLLKVRLIRLRRAWLKIGRSLTNSNSFEALAVRKFSAKIAVFAAKFDLSPWKKSLS
jgi:hypothetical protein